jgi:hypothetical protein
MNHIPKIIYENGELVHPPKNGPVTGIEDASMELFTTLDIVQIIEIVNSKEVNSHLEQGWKLLTVRNEESANQPAQTVYVLGLPRVALPTTTASSDTSVSPSSSPHKWLPVITVSPPNELRRETTRVDEAKQSAQLTRTNLESSHSHPCSTTSADQQPPRSITLVSRLSIDEAPAKRRQKTKNSPIPSREPSEEEVRERAA